MRAYWTLVRRELGAQFYSWAGYIIIAAVLFLLGMCFFSMLEQLNGVSNETPVTQEFFVTWYFWVILIIATPMITMRTLALEKYSGTFEMLMTTPVGDWQVVLAKYTGAMLFYMLMWLPLLVYLYIVRSCSNDPVVFEASTIGSTYLGIILLGSVYVSMGCFVSALTRSQIIAAMSSLAIGMAILLFSRFALEFTSGSGAQAQFFNQISLIEQMQDFAGGQLDTRPMICYLSLTLFFLFLTFKAVESRRWK